MECTREAIIHRAIGSCVSEQDMECSEFVLDRQRRVSTRTLRVVYVSSEIYGHGDGAGHTPLQC
jgi:hypothetical protein